MTFCNFKKYFFPNCLQKNLRQTPILLPLTDEFPFWIFSGYKGIEKVPGSSILFILFDGVLS